MTYEMLRERFGPSAADIVKSVTEPNKELPWPERKRAALKHLKKMVEGGLWVKAADTISNVAELLDDYAREPEGQGDKLFGRFNAPKVDIVSNYLAVMDVLIGKQLTGAHAHAVRRQINCYGSSLFGREAPAHLLIDVKRRLHGGSSVCVGWSVV